VDPSGRTTAETFDPTGLARTTSYGYSSDGYVTSEKLTDPTGLVSSSEATYDPMGRVTSRTDYAGTANRPAGWWNLGETSGSTAADWSGNQNTATWNTAPTWSGGAASFNGGSNGPITTPGPVLNTAASYSVSAWVNLASMATMETAVAQGGVNKSSFYLQYNVAHNEWYFNTADNDTNPTTYSGLGATNSPPALGVWTHLVGTYNATTGAISLYVNGSLAGTMTATTARWSGSGPLTLGGSKLVGGTVSNTYDGLLANVSVYQRTLSAADVSALYTAGRTGAALSSNRLTTTYTVDTAGLTRSVTDPNGNTTNYDYDEAGQVSLTTDPAVPAETGGGTPVMTHPTTYTGYNTFGEAVEDKDALGNVITTGYDAEGRVVQVTEPSYTPPGSTTPITPVSTRSYTPTGDLASETDPLGHTTSYTYDQFGRVASVTNPNNGVTTDTHDLVGDVLSTTDPTGAVGTSTYDYLGRRLTETAVVRQDSTNDTTSYTYGTDGRLQKLTTPAGVTTSYTYNPAGEALTTTDGANNTVHYAYNGAGQLTTTTAPDNTRIITTYDLGGRPTGVTSYDANNAVLTTANSIYDGDGQVTGTTDPRGTTTTYTYDAVGQPTSEVQPISATDAITTTFGYDAAGNRTRYTDGRGNPFITTYNAWNLPESTIEPATTAYPDVAANGTFKTSYDAAGNVVTRTSPGGASTSYTYDALDQLTAQHGAGADAPTTDRSFGYDPAGHLTSATTGSVSDTFTYDDRGLLRSATGSSGSAAFAYTPDGSLASRVDAAGTTAYTYDSADRLATLTNTGANVSIGYHYNTLSQPDVLTYNTTGDTRTFSYDTLHRVTGDELRTSNGTSVAKISYGWDANSNETSKTTTGFTGAAANTYTYDLANRLTSWNNGTTTTGYAYDKSGNRTQAGSDAFTYDQRDQLLTSENGATSYTYTPRGTLSTQTGASGTLTTTTDAFGQVATQGVTGGGTRSYTYDPLGRVLLPGFAYTGPGNTLATDGAATYTRDDNGALVGVAAGSNQTLAWTDLHTDQVAQFTPTATTVSGSTTYDPLGRTIATAGMAGNLGYQSEYTDPQTQRANMAARWYNTATGQFDTRDTAANNPIPNSANANPFAYGNDNPLTVTDPTGHCGWTDPWNCVVTAAKAVYHYAIQPVVHLFSSGFNYLNGGLSYALSMAYHAAVSGYHTVVNTYHRARAAVTHFYYHYVAPAYHWVYHAVTHAYHWVAHTYHAVARHISRTISHYYQAGRHLVAQASRLYHTSIHTIADAAKNTATWVRQHKNLLIEGAGIIAGVAAGALCTAVTAGVGALGCMIGAGALINLAKDAAEGRIHSLGAAFGSLATGALTGALGMVGGEVGGGIASWALGKIGGDLAGGVIGGFASRFISGAAAGSLGSALTQLATTGRIDLGQVGQAAAMGGAFGGFSRGPTEETTGPAEGGSGEVSVGETAASGGATCHSFDLATPVLMANGTTKPIGSVALGDTVESTDPATGKNTPQRVVALHDNHDTDLADVTVKTSDGKTTTLHTTQHHPFWNDTDHTWTDAAQLKPGKALHVYTAAGRSYTAKVIAVKTWTGLHHMRDLTVANIHTYYVLAGNTPVLVHNCDPYDLYHGTSTAGAENIRRGGVDPSYPSTYNRDYGDAFYTTPMRDQAEIWAARNHGANGAVLHFQIPRSELSGLSTHMFRRGSLASLDFLRSNRSGLLVPHGFDAIEGDMLLNPKAFLAGAPPVLGGWQVAFFGPAGGRVASILDRYLQ
jgi:RHS repeat-associated protein